MKNYMDMKTAFECEDKDIPFIEAGFNFNSKFSKKKLKEYPISTQYVAEIIEGKVCNKLKEKGDQLSGIIVLDIDGPFELKKAETILSQ